MADSAARRLIRQFREADLDALAALWNRTKRAAYPYLPAEQTRSVTEDRAFLATSIVPHGSVWVCENARDLVGFLAMRGNSIDRLYVAPEQQRRGVGTLLMATAFRTAEGSALELHTHQANVSARALYERLGFRAVAFGTSPPPESAPDVLYRREADVVVTPRDVPPTA